MQLFQLHLLSVNLNAMDFNLKACLLVLISILTVGFFSISDAQIKANSIVVPDSLYNAEELQKMEGMKVKHFMIAAKTNQYNANILSGKIRNQTLNL